MPMSLRVELERPGKLGLVMHFGEHVHAEIGRRLGQVSRRGVVDRRHDDEDAIGAERAGLHHLVGVDHEVLAQDGEGGRLARGGQIIGASLEGGRVGQHRQAGGAAHFISARQRRRIELGADQALRRARFLDLGDEGELAFGDARPHSIGERPHRRLSLGAGAQGAAIGRRLGGFDLFALIGEDGVEHLGHRLRLYHG